MCRGKMVQRCSGINLSALETGMSARVRVGGNHIKIGEKDNWQVAILMRNFKRRAQKLFSRVTQGRIAVSSREAVKDKDVKGMFTRSISNDSM